MFIYECRVSIICLLLISADDTTTLFRSASLTTTLMDHYMRSTANGFLHQAVQDFILKVMDSRQSCEVSIFNFIIALQNFV